MHQIAPVEETLDMMKPCLKKTIKKIEDKIEELEKNLEVIEQGINQLMKSKDSVIENIAEESERLTLTIRKEQKLLEESVVAETDRQVTDCL